MSRQKLGQHFLRSQPILERIVQALDASPNELVLEIGPGKGALTRVLLEHGLRVEAVELDASLVEELRLRWPAEDARLRVHCADILEVPLDRWGPIHIAGNLPYYITSPILRKVFAMGDAMRSAVFLMQREVAERLAARPGSRDYGYLSVLAQWRSEPELLFRVPPGAFHVPPKVESAVVRLRPASRSPVELPPEQYPMFEAFLGWCFVQKRKTLRNNLRMHVHAAFLGACGVATMRAEQLALAELADLFRSIRDSSAWRKGDGKETHSR